MTALPLHVAAADEPVPALGDFPHDGPDMRAARPIAEMLSALSVASKGGLPSYVRLWRYFVHSVGGSVGLLRQPGEAVQLLIGSCVDVQHRHRARWLHHLTEDLFAHDGAREALEMQVTTSPYYRDERPRAPRAVTAALRAFLAVGGRILVDPAGNVEEGFGHEAGRRFRDNGNEAEWQEFLAAGRAYFSARSQLNCDPHIARAVRMLGRHHSNGWQSLQRPAARPSPISEISA